MTWFKVDDGLWGHPKWLATPASARGLWVTAGSWSACNLTDGVIPRHVLPTLGGKPKDAATLVEVGLWIERDGGGWLFHEWNQLGRQPTKEAVMAEREASADRQKRAREKAAEKKSQEESRRESRRDAGVTHAVSHAGSHGPPDPTRPVLKNKPLQDLVCRRLFGDAQKPTTDDEKRELWLIWAETAGHSVDLETELGSWLMHNGATDLKNPGAALLGWLRTAAKRTAIPAVPGCDQCIRGWVTDEFGQPSEHRCTVCRPHLRSVEAL